MNNKTEHNVLIIDAGNSAVKWAISGAHGLSQMQSALYPQNISSHFFIELWQHINKPICITASCVANDSVWLALSEACKKLWSIDVNKVISLKDGYGLKNAYENASSLGSDRWAAMIGARELTDNPFMLVGAGSALTIDMVNETGQHMGGYIIPGLSMMRESLSLYTANIKVADTHEAAPTLSLANSTSACVEAGIHLSAVKLIEAVNEQQSKQVNKLQCYLTGGNAKLIAELLEFKCDIVPDIVLRGLDKIAVYQNQKNN